MDKQKKWDLMTKARTQITLDHPFFGSLVLRLKMIEDPNIPTACTDGRRIRYNPTWFNETLTDAQRVGVLAHEVLHVSNGHIWRLGHRDMRKANIAMDYAINPIVIEAGMELPEGCLIDAKWNDMAYEEIYAKLPDPLKGQSGGQKGDGAGNEPSDESDPGGCGGVELPAKGEDVNELEGEWKVAVTQAAQAAKMAGKLPASLQRLVDEFVNPQIPWTTLLRDFVETSARNDYNWTRPNVRHLGRGIVLPSLISEELPAVVVVVDTSGSIGRAELNAFAAEASAVLGAYETTIHLLYADAAVNSEETLTRADLPMQLKPCGGGGTDFRPAFDWVAKSGVEPSCLIYLTDGFGIFPKNEPEYPTLWVLTTGDSVDVPFGTAVELAIE